ncbi:tetra-peptide repeat homeobox protein 1-like [Homarus americanus]|uniref:tetra-peptide repeat homeobox protein 1-like n=1 Tax=Homarus americanus TaxID=6706 RepID=UPI001C444DBE|nr:tetra-peptide repeat homeobox protein 1-like [Homarus americanus]
MTGPPGCRRSLAGPLGEQLGSPPGRSPGAPLYWKAAGEFRCPWGATSPLQGPAVLHPLVGPLGASAFGRALVAPPFGKGPWEIRIPGMAPPDVTAPERTAGVPLSLEGFLGAPLSLGEPLRAPGGATVLEGPLGAATPGRVSRDTAVPGRAPVGVTVTGSPIGAPSSVEGPWELLSLSRPLVVPPPLRGALEALLSLRDSLGALSTHDRGPWGC